MTLEQIAAVIDALPLPVLIVGPDERVRVANEPLEAILGPDLVGKHYITALRQPAIIDAIAKVRSTGGGAVTRFVGRDGDKDTTYRVSLAEAGGDTVLTFEDQTAAEDAGKMRREFVANVSHELRTPLTALLGFIETLSGAAREDAAARDRFLGIMAHEANRMTRLVDDLLSLSRVEEDERVRPREHVDLGALLSSVIKGLEPQAESAAVEVKLDLQSSDEMVPGDAGQLVQVFTNLVENGIKYGAAGKEILVTLYPKSIHKRLRGEGVEIRVADKGEGIASHHLARLTERFYRVDNHRSREVGGTGLGLAIVKHIVNRHRGRLLIESEEGQGTQISVFLPTN
ncbi:ATP-binding protein [Cognatiyoonia sp. IB215446]|uniref:sensor histidine kinase n=1 Tax=Cognatiyoonia sp. IB215446 TaxID=3097355 RepID=UPI002A10F3A3|nr:ATP-binding protein [Cognatiyoonia sp. IB215446]MDX8349011.1 ATP-binding protein [Cognatiyoonia sp. IB215446]